MRQQDIWERLREYEKLALKLRVIPDRPWNVEGQNLAAKLTEIVVELRGSVYGGLDGRSADAANSILNSLLYHTGEARPDLVTNLFPVFALLCGDRQPDAIYADIDWSVMKEK